MSEKSLPQFADTVEGVQLARNTTLNYTREEIDDFERRDFKEISMYQRFVKIADLKAGETILDLACGPALTGLLVCEQLGKDNAVNLTFADASEPMLEKAEKNIRQIFDPDFPVNNFHHIDDMRSSGSLTKLKLDATAGVGFDVVLLENCLHYFTSETQPILLKRLLTLLAPGGRIVIDWMLPGSSHQYLYGKERAKEVFTTWFGYQQILTPEGWNDLKNWKLETQLEVKSNEIWVSKNEKKNAQKKLNAWVAKAGGKVVKFDEGNDRTGGNSNHLEQLKLRRAINNKPPGAGEGIQLDFERNELVGELLATEKLHEVQKVGDCEFMNMLVQYTLHAVVQVASEEQTKTAIV